MLTVLIEGNIHIRYGKKIEKYRSCNTKFCVPFPNMDQYGLVNHREDIYNKGNHHLKK
jgi:hypothetical protein